MRSVVAASTLFLAAMALALSGFAPATQAEQQVSTLGFGDPKHRDGQAIFRFDTFGDEQLWTDTLRMHEVIPKSRRSGDGSRCRSEGGCRRASAGGRNRAPKWSG